MAVQEQALRTRWMKAKIDGEADVDPMCRLCGEIEETVTHLVGDHIPSSVSSMENGDVEIYWDRAVVTVTGVEHNRPDCVVIERNVRKWTLIDFSVPMDQNVDSKEGSIVI